MHSKETVIQVPTQQAGIGELLGSRRTERILIHENASFLDSLQAVSLFFLFLRVLIGLQFLL